MILAARSALAGSLALALCKPAVANPEGADWTVTEQPEGCGSCHFDTPVQAESSALSIHGLPEQPEPGHTYTLTLTLQDPQLVNAGFLLTVAAFGNDIEQDASQLSSRNERIETNGNQARSSLAGSKTEVPGEASWTFDWTLPATPASHFRFDLWGNAGNDDLSAFGDRIHRLSIETPAVP